MKHSEGETKQKLQNKRLMNTQKNGFYCKKSNENGFNRKKQRNPLEQLEDKNKGWERNKKNHIF